MQRALGARCTQYYWMELQQVEANQNVSQINYDWWKADKSGNGIYWNWNCQNIRYDWVDKNICIFENLEKVIFLAWSIANG